MSKFIHTEAVVIKRNNYSDADRFITFFTHELGKVSALARGVRKVKSRKRYALEPLNRVQISLVRGNRGFVLTEAKLINPHAYTKETLPRLTQAVQVLEIVDGLTAEEEEHPAVYIELVKTLELLNHNAIRREGMLTSIMFMLDELGFGTPHRSEDILKQHIEDITQKTLKSKEFFLG